MLKKNNVFSKFVVLDNNLATIFILLFVFDSFSKIGDVFSLPISVSASILKLLLQCFLVYFIIKSDNKTSKKILFYIFLLLLIFLTGHIILKSETHFTTRIYKNIKNFDWYIYIFVLQASLISYFSSANIFKELQKLFKVFEYIFYINCLCIIIGMVFNLEIFKAYYHSQRFGFNGLLRNATHASYIFIVYILYFHYRFKVEQSLKTRFHLALSIIICFTLMTKAVILFLIFYLIYQTIAARKYYLLVVLISIISGFTVFFREFLEIFVKQHSPILYNVYKEEGVITMLFSFRDKAIGDKYLPYVKDNWAFGNYVFGGAEFNLMRTEFEILDLYWLFGLGSVVYIFAYNRFILSFNIVFREIPILILLIVILLAGSFLSSAPVVMFFLVFTIYYRHKYELMEK